MENNDKKYLIHYGEYSFINSTSSKIIIPNEPVFIEPLAFAFCNSVQHLSIKADMDTIPKGLCKECKNLKVVSLPASIREIQDEAFAGCSNLEKVVIGRNTQILPPTAFKGCHKLFSRIRNFDMSILSCSAYPYVYFKIENLLKAVNHSISFEELSAIERSGKLKEYINQLIDIAKQQNAERKGNNLQKNS